MDILEDSHFSGQFRNKENTRMLVNPNAGEHFGEHVMIDGYECSEERLDDRQTVLECLTELPERLLMNALSAPAVYYAEGNSPKDTGGWTGFVVIEESHISIHTFPGFRFVSIDVYTCKNGLIVPAIENYFKEKLGVRVFETNFVKRGVQFAKFALNRNKPRAYDHQGSLYVTS